ncbi:ATP-binding protein [Streptomyces sp. NBC_01506]|uniref:ATP-binding protein n=1 Tax=Streptomyces sp. NBC_01506 TaxID=2903887 RepID=UPI003868435E
MTPALIGRDHPAGVLRAEIGRATDSHGGLVLVAGEAGIGKTTLVTAAALEARQRGALVLGGSCWEGSAPGYWPWVQVVRGMRRGVGEEEWAKAEEAAGGRLAVLLGEAAGADEAKDAFSVYDAVTTALVTISQHRPVVVVLDDLHWADTASLRLLEFAAQHAWFERLLLIGTYRDVEVDTPGHPLQQLILPLVARATAAVTLTGLDRDDVGALLALTTGREPAPTLVDEVHSRTGGNPFFVEQTARLWHGGSPVSTIAPGVRDAVRRRLSMLPNPVGDLLLTASVLGREFHRQVLAAVTASPVPHVDRLLDRAVAARLVVTRGGGRFAFAHDLVRETLYACLEEPDAARLHGAVVRSLATAPALSEKIVPADLARHAHLAGETVDRDHRIDLLLAAARDASSRLAADEAVGHFRRALEVAETSGEGDPRRAVLIALDLAGELRAHGMEEEAQRYYDRAVTPARELGDPELLTRVALTLHQQQDIPGQGSQAGELLHEAYRALFGGGGAGAGQGSDAGGGGSGSEEMERMAQDLAVRATDLARRDDDDDALAFSLWARHDTIWGLGSSDERLALTTEMSAVARRTQNLDMEVHAGAMRWVTLLEMGDPRYLGQLRTYRTLADRAGKRRHELGKAVDMGIVAAFTGDFEQAEKWYADTLEVMCGHAAFGYLTSHLRWALLMMRGRYEEADAVTRGLDGVDYPFPVLLEGIAAIERGDTARALRLLHEVADRPEPVSRVLAPLWFRLLAHTAAASGDPALIAKARDALGAHSGRWLVALYGCDISGPVDLWLGLLDAAEGRWDAAVAAFTSARDSADRLQARPWSLRAGLALADALRARGGAGDAAAEAALRAETARAAAAMGLRHLERRGPEVQAEVVRPELVRPGVRPAAVPGAADEPASPTPPTSPDPPDADTRRGPWVNGPWAEDAGPGGPGVDAGSRTEMGTGTDTDTVADTAQPQPPTSRREFRRDGAVWALAFDGRAVHVPDAKGLRDLHTLVSHPGTDFPAVRLLSPDGGETAVAAHAMGGDPVLDERAKAEYRRRLDQLDQEIDRAGERGDDARAAAYDRERQALLDELRTAAGLGGRTRRLGDEAERARKTVTARIRDTLRKLDALHPELAAHLRRSVTTGATCAYRPDRTDDDTSGTLNWRL